MCKFKKVFTWKWDPCRTTLSIDNPLPQNLKTLDPLNLCCSDKSQLSKLKCVLFSLSWSTWSYVLWRISYHCQIPIWCILAKNMMDHMWPSAHKTDTTDLMKYYLALIWERWLLWSIMYSWEILGQEWKIRCETCLIWSIMNLQSFLNEIYKSTGSQDMKSAAWAAFIYVCEGWQPTNAVILHMLRLPHRYDAKIAKICKLWTSWPVIQPISHLFKISQKRWFISCLTSQNVQRLQIFDILASFLWGNLNRHYARNPGGLRNHYVAFLQNMHAMW